MIWYFAYGSNLCRDQMITRTGELLLAAPARIARLSGFRLAFNMRADDGQVYANIHSPGSFVLGVLYWCAADVFERLDPFEAGYSRERIMVDCDGKAVEASVYKSNRENLFVGGTPEAEYVQRILRGSRERDLPEAYVREIEQLARLEFGC
jgi:hypothetical protein